MFFSPSTILTTLVLAAGVIAAPSAETSKACDELSAALPKRVSTRLTLSYIAETKSYWSTLLQEVRPACLVLPQSAEEVSKVVKILNKHPGVEFAVKSGGHTPNERHSSIEDGVLISTKDLSGTTYDPDTKLAYVKPGGEWNDVLGALEPYNAAVVGGRIGLYLRR